MAAIGSRVNVGTSPTLLAADVDTGAVLVRNRGAASIDLGGPSVASGAGFQLDAGESVSFDIGQGEMLFGVAASGTVATHVLRSGA